MLLELQVKILALIEQARIEFGEGLNILTGETGAGKSILPFPEFDPGLLNERQILYLQFQKHPFVLLIMSPRRCYLWISFRILSITRIVSSTLRTAHIMVSSPAIQPTISLK